MSSANVVGIETAVYAGMAIQDSVRLEWLRKRTSPGFIHLAARPENHDLIAVALNGIGRSFVLIDVDD
jgi:hypothetical protein